MLPWHCSTTCSETGHLQPMTIICAWQWKVQSAMKVLTISLKLRTWSQFHQKHPSHWIVVWAISNISCNWHKYKKCTCINVLGLFWTYSSYAVSVQRLRAHNGHWINLSFYNMSWSLCGHTDILKWLHVFHSMSGCIIIYIVIIDWRGINVNIKDSAKVLIKTYIPFNNTQLVLIGLLLDLLFTGDFWCSSLLMMFNNIFFCTSCIKWELEIFPRCIHKSKRGEWSSMEKYMA